MVARVAHAFRGCCTKKASRIPSAVQRNLTGSSPPTPNTDKTGRWQQQQPGQLPCIFSGSKIIQAGLLGLLLICFAADQFSEQSLPYNGKTNDTFLANKVINESRGSCCLAPDFSSRSCLPAWRRIERKTVAKAFTRLLHKSLIGPFKMPYWSSLRVRPILTENA